MSRYYFYKCQTCNKESDGTINHGKQTLIDIYNDYRRIYYLELKVLCFTTKSTDQWTVDFLAEHWGHNIIIEDEYHRDTLDLS